jgi:hypothetical protein
MADYKPCATELVAVKPIKLTDGGGPDLEVRPAGANLWPCGSRANKAWPRP